ncbi:MAG: phage head closure protein [Candidatus Pacearchaeota archaeon]|jgi:SPP1 family predicted phage head-tail adaptor
MADCTKIRRTSRRICIGALNRKIIINARQIMPPSSGSVDFTESFTVEKEVWALVESVTGKTIFDSTNTEQVVTHNVYIRYLVNITPEKWLKFLAINGTDDVYLNILRVENLDEGNKFYKMTCNLRGTVDLQVNEA